MRYARLHFEEGLLRAGFRPEGQGWTGTIRHEKEETEVHIALPVSFPFQVPKVAPTDFEAVPWSWHRNSDGSLCLVAEHDHFDLWWQDVSSLLRHVSDWFTQANLGWPEDEPMLDLERYYSHSADNRLYLYEELGSLKGSPVLFRQRKNATMVLRPGPRPRKTSKQHQTRYGRIVDVGVLEIPPRSWPELADLLDASDLLERDIRNGKLEIIVICYRRGTRESVVMLEAFPTSSGDIQLRSLTSAPSADGPRSLRSGLLAPQLGQCRVAIVGLGAVGSFTADLLVRSGVRHLTLIDGDVVKPGNLVRHLVGPRMIGMEKVAAVKEHLVAGGNIAPECIEINNLPLFHGDEAFVAIREHDLVVNATADFATTALLHTAAHSLSKHILSTTIQGDGSTYRVDVLPPLPGVPSHPPTRLTAKASVHEFFEPGCGSPVSSTPPDAVYEAAAVTARHAVGLLVGQPIDPAGVIRNIDSPQSKSREKPS